ncbi:MAG: hypothetical protein KKD39_01940 [Candidatus Altiarchaeota archaeon]|nr:hypothetical protein [Candidatus Altiarchaeota archaeon]
MPAKNKKPQETEGISFDIPVGGIGNPLIILSILTLVIASVKPLMDGGTLHDNSHTLLWMLALIACYAIFQNKENSLSYGIPILVAVSGLFSFYSNQQNNFLAGDFNYFTLVAAIFALFYSLSYYKKLSFEVSAVAALFLSTMLLHMVPANGDYLAALDPYWHFKWMRGIYDSGYPPEHDYLVYPLRGGLYHSNDAAYIKNDPTFGLDQKKTAMFTPVSYTTLALAFKSFGLSLHDVAMLFPGVISALTVVVMYLLVSEMFSEMQPYNKIAALAAAFMLMLSPAFAMKSVASNSEDDALGMFFMVAGLFLFFASMHRKSIMYSVFCGFAFLLLRMGWGGAYYAFMTVGIFGTIYAIVRFLHGKNTIEHLPYLFIPALMYQFMGLIIHARGGAPIYHMMIPNALYPTLAALSLPILFEAWRIMRGGETLTKEDTLHYRFVSVIEKNIYPLAALTMVVILIFLTVVRSPMDLVDWVMDAVASPDVKSVVHQTVAEQNQLANTWSSYVFSAYDRFGVAFIFALIMAPFMAYLVYSRASTGALFLLTWSLPMMYGIYYRSLWVFASSAAIIALGSTVGLFAAASKKDLDGFRVVGTILLLVVPALYIPMFGTSFFNKFVGYQVMHMGASFDRRMWESALSWHRDNTAEGDAIVTWWDYGHWFTSISQRPVLIDNLQADYYEIQDVARFFVNKTTEDEAVEVLKPYERAYQENKGWHIKYVTIDWTMIGKGSALHYIATGIIENRTPGSWKNYIECEYVPELSSTSEQLKVNADGSFTKAMNIVFGCQNQHLIVFEISGGEIKDTYVVTPYRQKIAWNTFSQAKDVSLLGVQPLMGLNETRVPSILACTSGMLPQELSVVCSLPQFNTLIWVPQEFNDFMLTKLYLGKYMDEYYQLGYSTRPPEKLKYFREIPDYNGDTMEDGDFSLGFVRSYEVNLDGFPQQKLPEPTID